MEPRFLSSAQQRGKLRLTGAAVQRRIVRLMKAFRIVIRGPAVRVTLLAIAVAPMATGERPQDPSQPAGVAAQAAKPLAFEVASIKPTPPEVSGSKAFAPSSGNSLSLQGMSLKELIQLAY